MPVLADPLPHVRRVVRDLLLSAPAYVELEPDRRRDLAESMVKVCHAASALIREEVESDAQARRANGRHLLAQAQSAGTEFSGVSAQKVAGSTQASLNAVSLPGFG